MTMYVTIKDTRECSINTLELWPHGREVEIRIMETRGNPSVTIEVCRIFVPHHELERAVQGCEANYDDPEVTKMGDTS